MLRHRIAALAAGMVAALALSACGTTEKPTETDDEKAAGGPVTVTDSRGEEITLDAPARKVVALEWGEAEMLVTLGVMPVGVADTEGYSTWVTAEKLDDSVKDVGTRAEPSVDSVVALDPDLVVMEETRESNVVEQLEEHVPVLVAKGSDASDNLQRMRDDFTMIATAVGKSDKAEQVLADFDSALAQGKQEIADAGAAGQSFVMADGWQDGSAVSIRPFGEGALVSEVAMQLGLENAWQGEADQVWGLGQTDVEGLTTIEGDDVRFLYNASDGEDVFADGLEGNRIWESLSFVDDGRVHKLSDGIWTFGGPKSCEQYADEIVKIYTS
ncbi:siderophore ABC transporter substrate-binding protein CdtB [Nocardiopsis rhodophaea]|uniref:Siderophore ABC transporter substrate-binding protein CdtB n=1 Tax=Nocardiopsis rhodophaea TaxID=280238 RepID=A0ABP5E2C7_9ACTN